MKTLNTSSAFFRNQARRDRLAVLLVTVFCMALGIMQLPSAFACPPESAKPISLDPGNPHYFLFRGRPTVLITSTEHYGAVINLDFDYPLYLNELRARGFNLTRLFSGVYVEDPTAFHIARNTLAPAPLRFICPWARSTQPGYAGGGNKFDLHTWDPAYFHRLKDFVAQAGKRGIVVEMVLFLLRRLPVGPQSGQGKQQYPGHRRYSPNQSFDLTKWPVARHPGRHGPKDCYRAS